MENCLLRIADELPLAVPVDVANWTENYAFIGYDFATGVGFAAYAGRWIPNPEIWREQLFIYLPDGTVLAHINLGRPAGLDVPGGGMMALHCHQPGGRWQITFDGAMRHDSLSRLVKEPLPQAKLHPVTFDVTIEHTFPVWKFPASKDSISGKFHYEQKGNAVGRIGFGGATFDFACATYRDHSRGSRELGGFDGHVWLQLHMPDDLTVSAYQIWTHSAGKRVKSLDQVAAIRQNSLTPAALHQVPVLSSIDAIYDPVTILMSVEGCSYELSGTPLATQVASVTEEVDFYYGLTPSNAHFYAIEQPFLFDSPIGTVPGYLQRSGRFSSISLAS